MIRYKLDKETTEILDRIHNIYKFKTDTITCRIAFSLSIANGDVCNDFSIQFEQNGREYTPTSNSFGKYIGDRDNFILYKSILDQHYKKENTESDFIYLYKFHVKKGLVKWQNQIDQIDITAGEHINFLVKAVNKGMQLKSKNVYTSSESINEITQHKTFDELLSFVIGKGEEGNEIIVKLNDLNEFDNRNIAIAGMAGSGKTQLIKDVLYQISKNSNNDLKFIFFDYKGEGDPDGLKSFLNATSSKFIDIIEDSGIQFNPLKSISLDRKKRIFSIKAFADTISIFVPSVGVAQKNILTSILDKLFDDFNGEYPSIDDLFKEVDEYYSQNKIKQDTLYAAVQDLTRNIFNCDKSQFNFFKESIYLNLPPSLSDTLRQLIVFLILRYLNLYFSSTNDCKPNENIFPLRYFIVIDEAHIYLKNKNARKALEDLLRLLRSKGVSVIMLTQGVEDFKTKDFDFASQVKLPICLNIMNKDYKSISSFVGTPSSKFKLESEIKKLESGMGLINIKEPQIIELRQWWKTEKESNF